MTELLLERHQLERLSRHAATCRDNRSRKLVFDKDCIYVPKGYHYIDFICELLNQFGYVPRNNHEFAKQTLLGLVVAAKAGELLSHSVIFLFSHLRFEEI